MMKPFAQFGRRRELLRPLPDSRLFLGDAPGPKAVYENTDTVRFRGLVISPFDLDHWMHITGIF
jgi:hypothetical protein